MKNFPHLISKLFNEPTLCTPSRVAALAQVLEAHMQGTIVAEPTSPPMGDEDEGDPDESAIVRGNTAIIPVHGTLVMHPEDLGMSECGCSLSSLQQTIREVERMDEIENVIYNFRTPGGSVTGVPETGRMILASRKHTIAYCDSECCSGGIWLAAQCQHFYATESSRIGSVGVYTLCLDLTEQMRKKGVKINAISAGKYKLLGAHWEPMNDDARAMIQARVDKIYAQFLDAMGSYRIASDEMFGNGLVFDGQEAAELGFTNGVVDGLEDIFDGMDD